MTLGRIRPEIEKLILYAAGESTITAAHVKELVMPQEESEGLFALIDAVRNANAPRALREVSALIDGGIQPPMILGQLRAAAIQLRPDARVKSGLEAVFRTDTGDQIVGRNATAPARVSRRGALRQITGYGFGSPFTSTRFRGIAAF